MASPNEIAGLQIIAVKPKLWRITESIDGLYHLEFSWYQGDKTEFFLIQSQRKGTKTYKTIKAVISDIKKVKRDALIHFLGS